MMTDAKSDEVLGRMATLKRFPTNPYALVAITEILLRLCPDDAAATELAGAMLDRFDEWPGPASLRAVGREIEERRKEKAVLAAQLAERKAHEETCPGYRVTADEVKQTIGVGFCRAVFGNEYPYMYCRKGDELRQADSGFCLRRQAEELAARPGWAAPADD